ncbi:MULTISPECIES: FadR/GntR family transcriptional regulator [Kribbella]|uniref:DNA-binding FadR family transcriptional regulator n=1 Tax=Kribbella pratensis TaxID=2512112 RepID=A0ABY2F5N3_9ACTN|nr:MULTISPECIES: FadR/GntR family transcriptional regulator [Kribbella]TDW81775.1 DNA-binding FadR family transcriptional regulator [Kribbella pratensis]TDW83404.1 DNA-binding FadR family transcriptional regulator [Kribbella sp. VKM Ac-2566]
MSGLADQIVEDLKRRILSGGIAPGEKLPGENSLVEEFGVSRTVVREAVSRLQAAGLVETFQGRGSFVLEVPERTPGLREVRSHRDVLDLMDFRIGVESEAAGLAALRRTDHQLKGIERALDDFRRVGDDPGRSVEADFAFHLKVAVASGNRFYGDLIGELGPMMIMLPRTRLDPAYEMSDPEHLTRVVHEHENISAAIARSEPEAARAAMRVHLSSTRHRLLTHNP